MLFFHMFCLRALRLCFTVKPQNGFVDYETSSLIFGSTVPLTAAAAAG